MPSGNVLRLKVFTKLHWPVIAWAWGPVVVGFIRCTVAVANHVHQESTFVLCIGRWMWQRNSNPNHHWARV